MTTAKIDLITENHTTGEFVLIIVEDGPWPVTNSDWTECLSRIQTRIYDAMDIAIDCHLAMKYPDAKGKKVRIPLDSPSGAPHRLIQLVSKLRELIVTDTNNYSLAIKKSPHISGLSITLGHEINPFN